MYDEFRELLIRIDERVKLLDERVDKLEKHIDDFLHNSRRNGWRDKGILALMASAIVGLVELLKRVLGVG